MSKMSDAKSVTAAILQTPLLRPGTIGSALRGIAEVLLSQPDANVDDTDLQKVGVRVFRMPKTDKIMVGVAHHHPVLCGQMDNTAFGEDYGSALRSLSVSPPCLRLRCDGLRYYASAIPLSVVLEIAAAQGGAE